MIHVQFLEDFVIIAFPKIYCLIVLLQIIKFHILLCCHYYIQLNYYFYIFLNNKSLNYSFKRKFDGAVQILDLVESGFGLRFRALDLSNDRLLWGFETL